jgi:hypothetical protein
VDGKKLVKYISTSIITILILSSSALVFSTPLRVNMVNASTANSFYGIQSPSTTIAGNPNQRHVFQPVHSDTITEVDKSADGKTWKYFAYDSDPLGTMIRLYYTNDPSGTWTPYSQNPIIGTKANYYRWPSTTYVSGVFNMFIEDRTGGTLERWTSTDGIHYTFLENVKIGGNEYKNPFIWFNDNDNKWYLYSHDAISSGVGESLKVRSASSLDGLKTASDTTIVSRNNDFGSPTMMFYNGVYWLLGEIEVGTQWQVVAYYSTTSPSSGFVEAGNSPVITTDESCPMLFLTQDKLNAYLYTIAINGAWYTYTHRVNINNQIPTSTPSPTSTPTPTPTASPSPSPTPTATPIPTQTPTPSPIPTTTPTPTISPTPTPTLAPTLAPTSTPIATPTPITSPTPSPTPTPTEIPTEEPIPTDQPPITFSSTPSPAPSPNSISTIQTSKTVYSVARDTPVSPSPTPTDQTTNQSLLPTPIQSSTPISTPKPTDTTLVQPSLPLPTTLLIGFVIAMSVLLSTAILKSQRLKNIRNINQK